jgi:hypothetical protein
MRGGLRQDFKSLASTGSATSALGGVVAEPCRIASATLARAAPARWLWPRRGLGVSLPP